MLRKIAVLLYTAIIIAAEDIHNDLQNKPTDTSYPSARFLVSNVQYNIPLEARILQSQKGKSSAILQEGVPQNTENSLINEYFTNQQSRYVIRPDAVKITAPSVAIPIQNPILAQDRVRYQPETIQSPAVQPVIAEDSEVIDREQVTTVAPEKLRIDTPKLVRIQPKTTNYLKYKQLSQTDPESTDQDISVPATYPTAVPVTDIPPVQYVQVIPSLYKPAGSVLAKYPTAVSAQRIPQELYVQANPGLPKPTPVPVIAKYPTAASGQRIPQELHFQAYPDLPKPTPVPVLAKYPTAASAQRIPQELHFHAYPDLPKPTPVPVLANYPTAATAQRIPQELDLQANPGLPKLIPVPVIYDADKLGQPQYVLVKLAQPSSGLRDESIISKNEAPLRLPQRSNLVYTKSVENPSVDQTAYSIPRQTGYSRAVSYSPASAVSRVRFMGSGISYAW